MRRWRPLAGAGAAVGAVVLGLLVLLTLLNPTGPTGRGAPAAEPVPPPAVTSMHEPPRGSSYVATAAVDEVTVRSAAGGPVVRQLADPTRSGAPLTFLVLRRVPGWVEVALPVRPNGSTGWVADRDVRLAVTPYRLVVDRRHHHLDVEFHGRRTARYPIGVGRAATPTPPGRAYLTELIRPPDPHGVYGPYAFGLSAFSPTLTDFAGGPGQIGLHGTDAPHGLGSDVSHGCLRVSNDVIRRLAATLPLGTPVEISR